MQNIQTNYSLAKLNTLHLISQANRYVTLSEVIDLEHIIDYANSNKLKIFVLGGGSNIILPPIYRGLVVHNQLKGIELLEEAVDTVLVKAMAGVVWDDFVAHTLEHKWFGLENLSLIPGTVGAAPIQNIGAYGAEVKDFIEYVNIYDSKTYKNIVLTNKECEFKYRDSYLKHNSHLIVTSVVFKLNKIAKLNMGYADIAKTLSTITNPSAIDLRECVIKTRQSKLPNPLEIGNVGSFFHNPILSIEVIRTLQDIYPNIPVYRINDSTAKVSAGWLIDNLGLKGYRQGNVGVYFKQALVLVNHGGANADEIIGLANYIKQQVWQAYDIQLNIEPLVVDESEY